MSERGKRVFRFLLDPERDADVIGRIEARPSMTGYVRELVRRDMHDERLDFAALKASELQAENAKLRELLSVMAYCNQFRRDCDGCSMNGAAGIITGRAGCDELLDRMRELGVEVDG